MEIVMDGQSYEVVITKKRGTKNTYFRVKKDFKLYVSTNPFVTTKQIEKMILENQKAILTMFQKQKKKEEYNDGFYYLGKKYEIIRTNGKEISLGESKVFIGNEADLDRWYQKEAKVLFQEHLDYWYQHFDRTIPYPSLTIRKMTSRWGVCNSKLKRVTLNLELMKRDLCCLDYVIVHELSHFQEMNHSARFWKIVEANYPAYKKVRSMMKEY